MTPASTSNALQQLYVTYFNRPADVAGLAYWSGTLDAGVSLDAVSASFAASGEFNALYGGKPAAELVKAVYQNLFNRAAEPAGVEYWSGIIDKGAISDHEAVMAIVRGARGNDAVFAVNKVSAAQAFTDALDTPAKQGAYANEKALALAGKWLSGVTDFVSYVMAKSVLPKLMADAIDLASGTVKGTLADGYIKDAIVFADTNNNGVWDQGEAKTTTDAQGNFTLAGGIGTLVSIGGTDIATGSAVNGSFKAPAGSTMISPLTTLVHSVASSGNMSAAQAETLVKEKLGIADTVKLGSYDPIALAVSKDATAEDKATALKVQSLAAQVNTVMGQVGALLSGAGVTEGSDGGANAATNALADLIVKSDDKVDLGSSDTAKQIVKGAAAEAGADDTKLAQVDKLANDAGQAIANLNQAIDTASSKPGADAKSLLTEIAKVQVVAEVVEKTMESGAKGGDVSGSVGNTSGTVLGQAIDNAAGQVGNVVQTPTAAPTQAPTQAPGEQTDRDGDGIADDRDNAPDIANAGQADLDGDGIGDVADNDDDGDGIPDGRDNAPLIPNPDQANNDGDALGDVVDNDDDNDGIPDASDPEPTVPTPTTAPTQAPTATPTVAPTIAPTAAPTAAPTQAPTAAPTEAPTTAPTEAPTTAPTEAPTTAPTTAPTEAPTTAPTEAPTSAPTEAPKTLTVSVDSGSGVLILGGSATGDITMALDADHVATFTRGGVTAAVKPDLDSITKISLASGQTLAGTAAQLSGLALDGAGAVVIKGSDGDQRIVVGAGGANDIEGGEGADHITLGAGADTVRYAFGISGTLRYSESFSGHHDTLSNFTVGADKIDLRAGTGGALPMPASLQRFADVDGGLVTNHSQLIAQVQNSTSFRTLAPMQAGIISVTSGDFAGSYLYLHRPVESGLDSGRDLFIKLDQPVGLGAVGMLNVADYFTSSLTAPAATISAMNFNETEGSLWISGAYFSSLFRPGEDTTQDIKANLDWSKLVWDINGDDGATANITFTLADIVSALVNGNGMRVVLAPAKQAAILATPGYGNYLSAPDKLDVAAGFFRDGAGNAGTSDAVANGSLSTNRTVHLTDGSAQALVSHTDSLTLSGKDASVDGAVIDFKEVTSVVIGVQDVAAGNTITLTNVDHAGFLSAGGVQGNLNVSSASLAMFNTGGGNDHLTSTATSMMNVRFMPGGGADVLTGGSRGNVYVFAANDYAATSVEGLLAAADTITNWNAPSAGNRIDFASVALATVAHDAAPVAGRAAVTGKGLATFHVADTTVALKLAAVVAATGGDPVGTAVVFNDGADAYVYVVGSAAAGLQAGDGLIKLNGVTASELVINGGDIVAFAPPAADNTPPTTTIANASFFEDTGTLYINGSNFNTVLDTGENRATDVKARLDWSKFVLDIHRDGGTTADIVFNVDDIVSAIVPDYTDGQLIVKLTPTKVAAILATPGYARSGLDVAAGFVRDGAGNTASTDGALNAGFGAVLTLSVDNTTPVAVQSEAGQLSIMAHVDGGVVDAAGSGASQVHVFELAVNHSLTVTNVNHATYFQSGYSNSQGNVDVSGAALTEIVTGAGNDHLATSTTANASLTGGGGADVMTGGTGHNTYAFDASGADFKADSVAALVAAADIITNWSAAAGNRIDFGDLALTTRAHGDAAVAGKATISASGLAGFDAAATTVAQKLAAVVAATAGDPLGTAVVFNHGADAYVYVVGHTAAGAQAGDALIKVNGVTAKDLAISGGDITGFEKVIDTTAPSPTISDLSFNEIGNLWIGGKNFATLFNPGDDVNQDVKANLDWSKLTWDVNGDGGATANIEFTLADIVGVHVAGNDGLSVQLTPAKAAAIKAAPGYGAFQSAGDKFMVAPGFIRDGAGNAATTDGIDNGYVYTYLPQRIADGNALAPVTNADGLSLYANDSQPDGAVIDLAGVNSNSINVSSLAAGNTITLVNLVRPTGLWAAANSGVKGNLVVTSSSLQQLTTGDGNDHLTSTAIGNVKFTAGGGADVLTGGTGVNTYVFAAGGADFKAASATDLLAAADTITNWNAAAGNKIDFGATTLASVAHSDVAVAGRASISVKGLATFDAADNTAALKLAAVAAAAGSDPVGTAVVFNDGADAYLYVVGNATAGVQAGDALIKLNGVAATELIFAGGDIVAFERPVDTTAPAVSVNGMSYDDVKQVLHVFGANMQTVLSVGEDFNTDIKANLDWSKLIITMHDDAGLASNIAFTLHDIVSARKTQYGEGVEITLTPAKNAELLAAPGYGGLFGDDFSVAAGFFKDTSGNVATTDARHGGIATIHTEVLADTSLRTPATQAGNLRLDVRADGAQLDASAAGAPWVYVDRLAKNLTVTVSHLDQAIFVSAQHQEGNLVASGSSVTTLIGGNGNDRLSSTAASTVTITGGLGADIMAGGTGETIYQFAAGGADFKAAGVPELIAAADTIANWNTGSAGKIDFGATLLAAVAHSAAPATGRASVSDQGLATFEATDSTLEQKLAAVASAAGADPAGTSVLINHGGDAYVYVANGSAGVQTGDALIKLAGVNGQGLVFAAGKIVGTGADLSQPFATLSYSTDGGAHSSPAAHVHQGVTLRIQAEFSTPVQDGTPTLTIKNGAAVLSSGVVMTKVDATHYYYDLPVPAGDVAAATISIDGTLDMVGQPVTRMSGVRTFEIDNTAPVVSVNMGQFAEESRTLVLNGNGFASLLAPGETYDTDVKDRLDLSKLKLLLDADGSGRVDIAFSADATETGRVQSVKVLNGGYGLAIQLTESAYGAISAFNAFGNNSGGTTQADKLLVQPGLVRDLAGNAAASDGLNAGAIYYQYAMTLASGSNTVLPTIKADYVALQVPNGSATVDAHNVLNATNLDVRSLKPDQMLTINNLPAKVVSVGSQMPGLGGFQYTLTGNYGSAYGGDGNDNITGGYSTSFYPRSGNDHLTGASLENSYNRFVFKSADLTVQDYVNGGNFNGRALGNLLISDAAHLVDSAFEHVTNMQGLTLQNVAGNSVVLGNYAAAAFNSLNGELDVTVQNGVSSFDMVIDASAMTGRGLRVDFHNATGNLILSGSNRVTASMITDQIRAGSGDDILTGGKGMDYLSGGGGRDVFRFAAGDSALAREQADEVSDFEYGDRLELLNFGDLRWRGPNRSNHDSATREMWFEEGGSAGYLAIERTADGGDIEYIRLGTGQSIDTGFWTWDGHYLTRASSTSQLAFHNGLEMVATQSGTAMGSSGDDVIVADRRATLTGNGGNDTFRIYASDAASLGNESLSNAIAVTDLNKGDRLDLGDFHIVAGNWLGQRDYTGAGLSDAKEMWVVTQNAVNYLFLETGVGTNNDLKVVKLGPAPQDGVAGWTFDGRYLTNKAVEVIPQVTATLSYSTDGGVHSADTAYVKAGGAVRVLAAFSQPVRDGSPQITIKDGNSIFVDGVSRGADKIAMTKIDATHYYFDLVAPSGNVPVAAVGISALDVGGNALPLVMVNPAFEVDNQAPSARIYTARFEETARTLTLNGERFLTLAGADGNLSSDLKELFDWSKLVWDINGDNARTGDIQFSLADIESTKLLSDKVLQIIVTPEKSNAITAAEGYGFALTGQDMLDIQAGFLKDRVGNAGTTDAHADCPIELHRIINLTGTEVQSPNTSANWVILNAKTDGATVNASNVHSNILQVGELAEGQTLTVTQVDHVVAFTAQSANVAGNVVVSGSHGGSFTGGKGNDRLTSFSTAPHEQTLFDGGPGSDIMTGGTNSNVYIFCGESDFHATSVSQLIAVADTITNWNVGKSQIVLVGNAGVLGVVAHEGPAAPSVASISSSGIASFDAADNTLALKLAAVVAAVGTDPTGTAVAFDDGDDAWIYLVYHAAAGVQVGDGLIRLQNAKATDVILAPGSAGTDATAPTATITKGRLEVETNTLWLQGTNFQTLLSNGESVGTNLKEYLDWSKLSWDIDHDSSTTLGISFSLADIASTSTVAWSDNVLQIVLTPAKTAAIVATPGYMGNLSDDLDIRAGFLKDKFGNADSLDGLDNGVIGTVHSVTLTDARSVSPSTAAEDFEVFVKADGAHIDASQVTSSNFIVLELTAGNTLNVTNVNHGKVFDAWYAEGNVVASGSVPEMAGGASSDSLTSTSSGTVLLVGGAGADTLTGGSGHTSYVFNAFQDFNATSVAELVAAADTITNWSRGWIDFDHAMTVVSHTATATAGHAAVSAQGLASFAAADNTLPLKLAAVVAAAGSDAVGTAVAFNAGSDAYLYVVGNAAAGVQGGDALIKLIGVTASGLTFTGGDITGF